MQDKQLVMVCVIVVKVLSCKQDIMNYFGLINSIHIINSVGLKASSKNAS